MIWDKNHNTHSPTQDVPSSQLRWQWNIPISNREYIFKPGPFFYCYVRLPEHALDYWQVVTNHVLKYLKMLPCKTCCSSAHQKQFDFMGITSARKCSIQFVQLCLKSKKTFCCSNSVRKISDTPRTETHTLCAFFGVQSSQETPSNVTFIPECQIVDLTEVAAWKKNITNMSCPPPKKKNIYGQF